MKVIKKINNNVALCLDSNGKELIAFGSGIGFPKTPYELEDLSKITRTYYGVNSNYLELLHEIPENVFEISAVIVEYAQTKIFNEFCPNVVFTLADHIHFAIERSKKNMTLKMPFSYDMEHLYEKEMEVGKKAVLYINKVLKIHLSSQEAYGIALHLINSENFEKEETKDDKEIIEEITRLIEQEMTCKINKRNFSYSRFVSHMQYLLKRKDTEMFDLDENKHMFEDMKKECPKTYACVNKINEYIESELGWKMNKDESFYLMIHVNRLIDREDCNR